MVSYWRLSYWKHFVPVLVRRKSVNKTYIAPPLWTWGMWGGVGGTIYRLRGGGDGVRVAEEIDSLTADSNFICEGNLHASYIGDVSRYWHWLVDMNPDDVIKWKHFPRYWPFVPVIYQSSVNSPHKGQWRGALIIDWTSLFRHCWQSIR